MDLDDSREICFCSFCGTKHIIKDEIVNNTTINNYNQVGKGVDELIADGEALLELGQIRRSQDKFKEAANTAPRNFAAWFGYARAFAAGKGESETIFETAYKLASGPEKEMLIKEWIIDIGAKNEVSCRNSYEFICKVCGPDIKEKIRSILADEFRKNIAEGKKFTYDPTSVAGYDDDKKPWFINPYIVPTPLRARKDLTYVYPNPYGLFRTNLIIDLLTDDEKRYLIAGIEDEIKIWEKRSEDHILWNVKNDSDSPNPKPSPRKIESAKKTAERVDTAYKSYLEFIAELNDCIRKLTPAAGAKADPANGNAANKEEVAKKKGFWKR
jgi:hypothetical protein